MCCFSYVPQSTGVFARWFRSRPLEVRDTRIFARVEGSRQALVYAMRLETPRDVAMVLPLPVRVGSGDAAVSFVDLSGYADFFDDMDRGFAPPPGFGVPRLPEGSALSARPQLEVQRVGSFDASYVPTVHDFDRLDPRFRLPANVWNALPVYHDHGFAVFRLRASRLASVHPMAFRFETREPHTLFLPTVHVHDGTVHPDAAFDHALYYQSSAGAAGRDATSNAPAAAFMKSAHGGLFDPDARVFKRTLRGMHPNTDVRVPA